MTGASEWQGRVGASWAAEWQRTDRSFAALNALLVERVAARVSSHARILDVGCGAGATSIALAERLPGAQILGIDLSGDLVAAAQARANGLALFEQADASRFVSSDFAPDLLVSRHGVMFFDDPVGAMRHLLGLVAPGGQMVFSCFRDRSENDWATEVAALLANPAPFDPHAPGPFAFADQVRVSAILTEAGWTDVAAEPLDVAYVAGAGDDPVADAVDFFSRIGPAAPVIRTLQGEARAAFLSGLGDMARNYLHDGAVCFTAAVWIWTARRPA
jgi:trans-aconitate methyltransferase